MKIYTITHKPTNRKYVGQTSSKKKNSRWTNHKNYYRNKINSHPKLLRAMLKYGIEEFEYEEIAQCESHQELDNLEIGFIKKFDSVKNGFNILDGPPGRCTNRIPRKGFTIPIKTREKISKSCSRSSYVVTTPTGEKIQTHSIRKFCKENNLDHGSAYKIVNKLRNSTHHHGYFFEREWRTN